MSKYSTIIVCYLNNSFIWNKNFFPNRKIVSILSDCSRRTVEKHLPWDDLGSFIILDTDQSTPTKKQGGGGRGGRMHPRGIPHQRGFGPRGGPPRFLGPGGPFPPMRPPFREPLFPHDGPPFDHSFDLESPPFDHRGPHFEPRFGARGPRGPRMEPPFPPKGPHFGPRGPRAHPMNRGDRPIPPSGSPGGLGERPAGQGPMSPGERSVRPNQPNRSNTLPKGPRMPQQKNQGKSNETLVKLQATPQKQQNQNIPKKDPGKTRLLHTGITVVNLFTFESMNILYISTHNSISIIKDRSDRRNLIYGDAD